MTGVRRPPDSVTIRYVAWRMTPLTEVIRVHRLCAGIGRCDRVSAAIFATLLSQPDTELAVQFAFATACYTKRAAVEILR
jgi:hypothetical protein